MIVVQDLHFVSRPRTTDRARPLQPLRAGNERAAAFGCREDEGTRGEKDLDALTKKHVDLIEEMAKNKEQELLEV